MDRKRENIDLLLRFGEIFLEKSKELQRVGIWTNRNAFQKSFEDALERLGVIYGYFVEYDPHEKKVKYFFENEARNSKNPDFLQPTIPYLLFDKTTPERKNEALIKQLKLTSSVNKINNSIDSPKVFQYLPIQPKAAGIEKFDHFEILPNTCLNCHIPCKIRSENDYYVVLFDEVAFFQYAYFHIKGNDTVFNLYNNEFEKFLYYLLKYAIGVELSLNQNRLSEFLKLQRLNLWKSKEENIVRKEIQDVIKNNLNNGEWISQIRNHLDEIVSSFINHAKEIIRLPESSDSLDILRLSARFDIEASLQLKDKNDRIVFHDIFVFPIYTQKKEKVFDILCAAGKTKIDIHSPILLVLYIKTLHLIETEKKVSEPSFDEDEYSIDGFQLTKEISKLFAERLVQEDYLKNVINKELQPAATRAAISQVMARNTSHNIGAHVMNKLIGDNLEDVDVGKFENYDMGVALSDDNKSIFKQIAIFNNYVKCRMDYLADISFGTPQMQTNKYVYQDIFKELDKVRLLLEYISGLSGFKYKIDFKRNGKSFDEVEDLLVAIPNDILGTQAFYNILENIIRNTAKHSQNKEGITVFTVNFIDDINETEYKDCENKEEIINILNEFIAVEVYDNVDVKYEPEKNDTPTEEQKKEYEDVTSDMLSNKIDWLVYSQNKKLNEDILYDNKLRSSSLGLIEMDASAAYLRKRDVGFINHDSYQINYDNSWSRLKTGKNCRHFLKAFNKKDISKSHLGYRFFLHRPAVILAITKIRPDNINELKKQGIWVTTPDYFKTYLSEGKVTNHDFVVYTENGNDELKISELIRTHKTFLPVRELKVSDDDMKGFLKKKSLEEFEEFCWEKWKGEKYNKPDIDIVNSFDKDCYTVFQSVFLDHLYSKDGNIKVKTEVETEWGKHKNADYVEALSSLGQSRMPDFYKLTDSSRCKEHVSTEKFKNCYLSNLSELVKHKIKEAVLTKVIVIDERIQEAAENNNFMGVSYKELYAKMGLVVPDKKKINLSENSFSKDFVNKTIKPFISEQIKDAKRTDFILIHYSILERMFIKEDINTYIEEELANNEINVVITSGRGIPDKLSEKVRFVNLSSVITSFIDIRSKYAINYLLNSTRKSNNI